MIRLNQVKMPLKHDRDQIKLQIMKLMKVKPEDLEAWYIRKESLDARKNPPLIVYTIDCKVKDEKKFLSKRSELQLAPVETYEYPKTGIEAKPLAHRPVIIGFGPAGMFAAWLLTNMGYKPLVLERGSAVDQRTEKVDAFWAGGALDPESNVQFGEGGAGAFSDGKLTTRIKDPRSKTVLEILTKYGAPEEIIYRNKPHIGTDILKPVVKSLREDLIEKGMEIRFDTRVKDFRFDNNQLKGVVLADDEFIPAEAAILAIGHSARDTFQVLKEQQVAMMRKPFAVGVRIEHPQRLVNTSQYDPYETDLLERFGAAEYHLTSDTASGRSVYTFCMCPGGFVIGAASEKNTIVTNGMSEHKRNQPNANSALLVNINPEDFPSDDILAGVEFQRNLERRAFELGGSDGCAPVMTVGAFLDGNKANVLGSVIPSYQPGVKMADLNLGLPTFITEAMREALPKMDRRLNGFAMEDAVMTGFETRTSSPIRILRDQESLLSQSHLGLYPCGEGAGYAGGIMSSACDGLRIAEKIIENWKL